MLKKFRSLFAQRTPVEIEIGDPDLRDEVRTDTLDPATEALETVAPEAPGALLADFRADLARQHAAQERIAEGIGGVERQLEPIARNLNRQVESIAGSERHVAELVEQFTRSANEREQALQETVSSLNVSGERQVQVLTLLQQQLDRSQQAVDGLGERFTEVGAGLETLAEAQRTTAARTESLVDAVTRQIESAELAHQRTFRVSVALLGMGTLAVLAAVVLVLVYN